MAAYNDEVYMALAKERVRDDMFRIKKFASEKDMEAWGDPATRTMIMNKWLKLEIGTPREEEMWQKVRRMVVTVMRTRRKTVNDAMKKIAKGES